VSWLCPRLSRRVREEPTDLKWRLPGVHLLPELANAEPSKGGERRRDNAWDQN